MGGGVRLALTVVVAGAVSLGPGSPARATTTGGVTAGATAARVLLVAQTPVNGARGKSSAATASPAERERLRRELARVNLEIDNLKRRRRGLGDDYVLRRRMADAEALARRLTEVETALGKAPAPAGAARDDASAGSEPLQAPPEARDTDDRAALEAKADILTDQARRLTTQANALEKRIGDLRQRGELRRRAGQLDRDPFSPMEQAKRRIALGSATTMPTESTSSGSGSRGADRHRHDDWLHAADQRWDDQRRNDLDLDPRRYRSDRGQHQERGHGHGHVRRAATLAGRCRDHRRPGLGRGAVPRAAGRGHADGDPTARVAALARRQPEGHGARARRPTRPRRHHRRQRQRPAPARPRHELTPAPPSTRAGRWRRRLHCHAEMVPHPSGEPTPVCSRTLRRAARRRPVTAPVRVLGVLAVASALASAARAGADEEHVTARAELGAEYDTNVHRAEQVVGATSDRVVASPLVRAVAGWTAAGRITPEQDVMFSVLGAAKQFAKAEARIENVGIVETSGLWRIAAGDRTRIGVGGSYYEAIQAGTPAERELIGEARDFRSLSPTVRAWRAAGALGTLGLGAGYRWFVYKPLRAYDFQAPVLAIEQRVGWETADGDAEWEVTSGLGVELRRFAGARLVATPAGCAAIECTATPDPNGASHDDRFFSGQVNVTRTGNILVGAGYAAQWNQSNSYSESVLRHVLTVRVATPLFFGVYLAARGELVLASYADRVALAIGPSGRASATFDDENRSHVRAELTRDLPGHLQLVARYSLYANALGSGVAEYRRQTATLSLAFAID